MIKKSLSLILPLALSIILSGCGDSTADKEQKDDSSSSSSSQKTATATFNAQSSGVTYQCGSQKGTLSESGIFKYEIGESCTFFDGTTIIKTVVASDLKQGKEINEEKSEEIVDTASKTAILQDLLMGKTYYSVEPKNANIYKLQFASYIDEDGALWVTAFGTTDQPLGSTTSHVTGNTLSVSMISLNLTFIEENKAGEYLLFDSERRMYLSKDKAEAFVAASK